MGTSATVLVIPKGIYTLKSLEKQIKKGNDTDGINIKIQVEEQRILLILPPEYDVILSPNILKMLRLTNIKTNEFIKKLENYSIPFQTVNTIYPYFYSYVHQHISSMENTPIVYIQHPYS